MDLHDHGISLDLDPATAQVLIQLAEMWGVTEQQAIRKAIEQAGTYQQLEEEYGEQLSRFLLLLLENKSQLPDVLRLPDTDLKVLLRSCLQATKKKANTKPISTGRIDAFRQLQRRLNLTETQAANWQKTIRDARR